ncbi:hypothetical protein RO3G_00365 [Rhizopus delemar RA 99-880]|uniref:Uncharacterized protein n=1 Tax=Rhizopus delemar (strain RA 99-880 / ATCC MYA-4621 / FGSC 9543 / NRRL 43880) TaxID=246409 RepID=I1BHI1_RHIO9|nr:hypothetical protein RO3G_00365 [Rhizopus delemar RA 99-880]|eukprot:EIE75661.1 hypothetical protein RO3G_00365 [Rhizopus delemar RA 99-880]
MDEILRLFNDSPTIEIIGNEQLNRPLTNLANEIAPSHHCKCRSDAHHLPNIHHVNKQFFAWSSESKWISLSIKKTMHEFLMYAMNFEYSRVLPWDIGSVL